MKLVDAEFVWTEPHSRRIKVNITVQKEAFGVVLQQSFIVCFIVEAKTCEDCIMESIEHSCKAVVQLRQKVCLFVIERSLSRWSISVPSISLSSKSSRQRCIARLPISNHNPMVWILTSLIEVMPVDLCSG